MVSPYLCGRIDKIKDRLIQAVFYEKKNQEDITLRAASS